MQLFTKLYNKTVIITENQLKSWLTEDDSNIKFKPTSEWMQKMYDEMNAQLFNNELGDCILRPFTTGKGSNGSVLGWFKITGEGIRVKRDSRQMLQRTYMGTIYIDHNNFVNICQPAIELNANYSATEDAWLATLVHEMCHYYTYMNGLAPKQGHGREFRNIGAIVSNRSNGRFTIQRLATAEEMQDMELDADIKAKNDARKERKKSNMVAILVLHKNGKSIELIMTSRKSDLLSRICSRSNITNESLVFACFDEELIDFLYNKGYKSMIRTLGRYWEILSEPWLNELKKYYWEGYVTIGDLSFDEILDRIIAARDGKPYNSEVMSASTPQKKNEQNSHMGFLIVKDGNGYNIVNEKDKTKRFGHPVNKIWFDDEQQKFFFKMGKNTFIGFPGKWTKYSVDENKNTYSPNKMNEDRLHKIIKETIDEMLDEKMDDMDSIDISPDMNLGIGSPFEYYTLF